VFVVKLAHWTLLQVVDEQLLHFSVWMFFGCVAKVCEYEVANPQGSL